MIPLKVLTLVFTGPANPAVLVLEPAEATEDETSRVLPIWIGSNEAMQLGVAIEHARLPRPMTHDLFLNAIANLDARVDHVVISDVKGQTFFAKLFLRQAGRLIELDARPTDAIALAIREGAPFMVEDSVMEKASFPYIFRNPRNTEAELEEFRTFIDSIQPEDFNIDGPLDNERS